MIRTVNRVALYARFSSDNQRSESIDAQLRAMEVYCQQHGYIIVERYIDEARSAMTDRRPAFQQMISDSAAKTFDILLVHKLDRFARNRYDSAVYKRELKKNGVTVYSVLENLDNSPESIMMEAVLEGMSEYYSQNLAREVMKGMRETALQCKHTGGLPALGYDVDPVTKRLVVNASEAEIVKLVFQMCADGYGYSAILDTLHEIGAHTKLGNDFQKNSLHDLLINPKYRGVYTFNLRSSRAPSGKRNNHTVKDADDIIQIEGGCPALVDEETFQKVQQRIRENKTTGGRNNAKESYLLSGLVFCRVCDRAMVGNSRPAGRNKARFVTYRCPTKHHSCNNKEINRDYLERYVVALLEREMLNPQAMKEIAAAIQARATDPGNEEAAEALNEELSEVSTALQNVADAVEAGLMSDTLLTRLRELETRKAILEDRLTEAQRHVGGVSVDANLILSDYAAVRQSPASPLYKDFIRGCISRIDVGRYSVRFTLKTGLGVFSELDRTVEVMRQEVYAAKAG